MDMDETGVAVKFRGQTLEVARYFVGERRDRKDVTNLDWGPPLGVAGEEDAWPSAVGNKGVVSEPLFRTGAGGCGAVFVNSHPVPLAADAKSQTASSPSLSVQLPSPGPPPRPPEKMSPVAPHRALILRQMMKFASRVVGWAMRRRSLIM